VPAVKLKQSLSFVLTFIALLGVLALAWFKDVDVQMLLPSILGIYIVGRTTHKVSAVWAASKDPNADTHKAIETFDSPG
jgi:uncharacterized membrane protein YadS